MYVLYDFKYKQLNSCIRKRNSNILNTLFEMARIHFLWLDNHSLGHLYANVATETETEACRKMENIKEIIENILLKNLIPHQSSLYIMEYSLSSQTRRMVQNFDMGWWCGLEGICLKSRVLQKGSLFGAGFLLKIDWKNEYDDGQAIYGMPLFLSAKRNSFIVRIK